jgi:hypothetical protein
MTLDEVKQALLTIGVPVYHYQALQQNCPYLVWQEEGQGSSLFGDGCMQNQSLTGSLVYYTKKEYDPGLDAVQAALNENEIAFYLAGSGYDPDTGVIHYSWVWEVPYGKA